MRYLFLVLVTAVTGLLAGLVLWSFPSFVLAVPDVVTRAPTDATLQTRFVEHMSN